MGRRKHLLLLLFAGVILALALGSSDAVAGGPCPHCGFRAAPNGS